MMMALNKNTEVLCHMGFTIILVQRLQPTFQAQDKTKFIITVKNGGRDYSSFDSDACRCSADQCEASAYRAKYKTGASNDEHSNNDS